jgi:hypothetical protein
MSKNLPENIEEIKIDENAVRIAGQTRADLFEDSNTFMVEKFETTDEGYLKGRAIVTNIGVFPYVVKDERGNLVIRKELRAPQHVFEEDSLNSLKLKPVTDTHPTVAVDSENIKELQAGFAGDSVRIDGMFVSVPLNVTKPETVDGITRDGNQAISCGYTTDLIEQSGTFLGQDYDAIQTNIRYNHIAVNIQKGRAGDEARLNLDSFDGYTALEQKEEKTNPKENKKDENNKNFNKEETMLKKITIDGVEHEAEAEVIRSLNQAQTKADDLQTKLDESNKSNQEIQAKLDSKNDEVEQLKKDKEELEKKDHSDEIEKAVEAKLQLKSTAEKADIEIKEDMSDSDIKKAVILSVYPNAAEKLDNADESYIDVRFDCACEVIAEQGKVDKKNKNDALDVPKGDGTDEDPDSQKAHAKMVQDEKDAWKKGLENE